VVAEEEAVDGARLVASSGALAGALLWASAARGAVSARAQPRLRRTKTFVRVKMDTSEKYGRATRFAEEPFGAEVRQKDEDCETAGVRPIVISSHQTDT
jgi:hypothetical protein